MDFCKKLDSLVENRIGLCIGLDPVIERMPDRIRESKEPLFAFNLEIIEHTSDYAAAFKPNLAFYEAHGADGWIQLEKTIRAVPDRCIVITDGKRSDIGSTAERYAYSLFTRLDSDAATVSPYLGSDSLEPFLRRSDKGVFILTLTSNPGGSDLQELECEGESLYLHVVKMAHRLNRLGNVGLVVGATKPEAWNGILELAENLPLLVPGIGAQGGDLEALKLALRDYSAPVLVNASRSIIYASTGDDFGLAAQEAARELNDRLRAGNN